MKRPSVFTFLHRAAELATLNQLPDGGETSSTNISLGCPLSSPFVNPGAKLTKFVAEKETAPEPSPAKCKCGPDAASSQPTHRCGAGHWLPLGGDICGAPAVPDIPGLGEA